MTEIHSTSWQAPDHPEGQIESNHFVTAKGDDVIGQLATIRLENGDTLPDLARHFSLGLNQISAANPGVDIWVPDAGENLLLPLSFTLPDALRKGIVINLAAMRLFQFKEEAKSLAVTTYPIGIGSTERPTPMGQMFVERKMALPTWYVPASIAADHRKKGDPLPEKVPPGPDNPLGEYALYLNTPSYLIHGTNKPASIGLRATNGCIRLYPEDVKQLFEGTAVNTPVSIVDQPYLIGHRDGVVYLEVHPRLEDSEADGIEKIYARLKSIEKKSALRLDWKKVEKTVAESRGIPVPISVTGQGGQESEGHAVKIAHPDSLYGRPEIPELKTEGWYVLAAVLPDETSAARLSAIINHQGPPIPARVLPKKDRYRVIAGPFEDAGKAKKAVKRLKIDLELDGIVIEPSRKK
ncbi:MAG: L,D-transpeptidase family protein [Desulfobacteraceae bacterium]|nr:L,D-transpeptidase family protein [Desulfobacteraceae bacterium]